ncbi:MAG: beta-N-acetylhexosaminidase [Dethiobacteria bacterium]|jgi:beta-N-acetylhexosaminidase
MKNNKAMCVFLLLFLIIMSISYAAPGCSLLSRNGGNTGEGQTTEKFPGENPGGEGKAKGELADEIARVLQEMTLEEKIGQMVIIGFGGPEIDDHVESMIREHRVGGLILFGRNIADKNQLTGLITGLQAINQDNRLPLFIAVDEEGGRISRLPQGSPRLPANKTLGEQNDPEYSFTVGQETGAELAAFGFNMNFAPVLDIFSNPQNEVIGDRSFGNNPEIVSRLGLAVMKGLQSKNIISVVKHFPGHGDTHVDSHAGLPVVEYDRKRLDSFEFVPFKEAIAGGAEAIMTAHIMYSEIDPGKPATMSREILTGILRHDLGFGGLIITDDLEMGAIVENYALEEAALAAVLAGADILLVCHSSGYQERVLGRLKAAVQSGELTRERVDESVARIIELKQKHIMK